MSTVHAFQPREMTIEDTSFIEGVELFLEEMAIKSESTAKNYSYFIKDFFEYILQKDFRTITWNDMFSITYAKVLKYRNYLIAEGNSSRTINTKIASLKSLYRELRKIDRRVDTVVVDVKNLPIDESEDSSYGALTKEEVDKLYEFALSERSLGFSKRMFFEVAITIAVRKSAILNIRWKDIKQVEEEGDFIWTIYTLDKGNKYDANPISDRLYSELIKLREEKDSDDDLVFKFNEKTLRRSLERFCKQNNIGEDRKITIHSLKKTSMDIVYEMTNGDVLATARHGHHEGVEMLYKHYQGKNKNLKNKPSYNFDNKVDILELEDYTKEELLKAIEQCGSGTMVAILKKLKG